jgi:putative resolvase
MRRVGWSQAGSVWALSRRWAGLSGTQPKLRLVLSGPAAAVVVVDHPERLAGFGVEHLEAAFAARGRKIVVAGPGRAAVTICGTWSKSSRPCVHGWTAGQARATARCAVTAAGHEASAGVAAGV